MLMEKIRHGVLQVATDHGPRYVEPSLGERLQLIWMFRNFKLLSPEVLNQHEQALIHHLTHEKPLERRRDVNPDLVIGTVECPASTPPKKRAHAAAAAQRQTA